MKFRPSIGAYDYKYKIQHVTRFLEEGSKVKLTVMLRGRELAHPELAVRVLEKAADHVAHVADVEHGPKFSGRNVVMMLRPRKGGRDDQGGSVKSPRGPRQDLGGARQKRQSEDLSEAVR